MKASELMARAENALRTGQTENLFPVIARRCLELIEEEKQANRREWVALIPSKRHEFAAKDMIAALANVGMAARQVAEVVRRALTGISEQRQSDYVLVGAKGGNR